MSAPGGLCGRGARSDFDATAEVQHQAVASRRAGARRGRRQQRSHMKHRVKQLVLTDCRTACWRTAARSIPNASITSATCASVRLNREFDAVFVHDAISYLTTEADVAKAIETAFVHCRAAAVRCSPPIMCVRRSMPQPIAVAKTAALGRCGISNGRGIRIPAIPPAPPTTRMCCASPMDPVSGVHDRHIEGIFPRETWLRLFRQAGFDLA